MDTNDYKMLLLLEQTGNITRAAKKLYISQSAFSKRIRAIEEELGTEILYRTRKGVVFTPAGEVVLSYSRAMQRANERLLEKLNMVKGNVAGTLKAAISQEFAVNYLPDILKQYQLECPDVKLHININNDDECYKLFADGRENLAVLIKDQPDSLPWELIAEDKYYLATADTNRYRPLDQYPYVGQDIYSEESALRTKWMAENKIQISLSESIETDDYSVCRRMVENGVGWSLLPESVLKDFSGYRRPCRLQDGKYLQQKIFVVVNREAENLPQYNLFLTLLRNIRNSN